MLEVLVNFAGLRRQLRGVDGGREDGAGDDKGPEWHGAGVDEGREAVKDVEMVYDVHGRIYLN